MIITTKFFDWLSTVANEDDAHSVYNWTIFIVTGLPLRSRILLSFEILMGARLSLFISKGQKPETNSELLSEDIIREVAFLKTKKGRKCV